MAKQNKKIKNIERADVYWEIETTNAKHNISAIISNRWRNRKNATVCA